MADLITVPTFTFNQGELGNLDYEKAIRVIYYNGTISLEQDGDYEQPDSISIHPDNLDKLFKEIKKHLPAANKYLSK